MEKRESSKNLFKMFKNENNESKNTNIRNRAKKYFTIRMKISPFNNNDKNLIIDDKKEQNKNNNNKKNNFSQMTNNMMIKLIKGANRRGTKKIGNLLSKSLFKKIMKKSNINKEYIFAFLNKNTSYRKANEIISVAEYLSKNYNYFTNLKTNESQLKVEQLAKIARLEVFSSGSNIINFGEMGDKFYIVLQGYVEVYKPFFESISATPNEFISLLRKIKNEEKNLKKYLRIKAYNKERNFDITEYENISPNMNFMNKKGEFFVEKLELLGKYGEGFSFGEMALIKNCQRNATIKSVGGPNENTILLSIDKESYNQAIKEYQEKKMSKDVKTFLNTYTFINIFNKEKILQLFNYMNRITLDKGDFLFHQNDIDNNLYFIINGVFNLSIDICFPWVNDYIDYITNMKDNIIGYILVQKPNKFSSLFGTMNKIKEKNKKSPMIYDKYYLWEKIEIKKNENNLIGIKFDEEKINNNKSVYKINIKKIEHPVLLGLEDSFEFKNKFYSIQCISEKAEVKSIKIIDFIKIIYDSKDEDLSYFLDVILKTKELFKNQVINAIKNLGNKILNDLEFKYENYLNSGSGENSNKEKSNYNDNDNNNKIVSVIKMKGYKNNIQDILDGSIDFLIKDEDTKFKALKNRKGYDIEELIELGQKKNYNFSKKKYMNKNNGDNSLLLLKNILKSNKVNKNIKKYKKKELNLSSFVLNRSSSNPSLFKSRSDRKLIHNYSSIISINETNNRDNNMINLNLNAKKKNIIYNYSKEKDKETKLLSQNNNIALSNYLNFSKIKLKINNNNNSFYKPLKPDTNFIKNKNLSLNSSLNHNQSEKKIHNFQYYNKSDIFVNNIEKKIHKNNSQIDKPFNSKNEINNNNSFYKNIDNNNKDFYLGCNFSKKLKTIFDQNTRMEKHNFPLINKGNSIEKSIK